MQAQGIAWDMMENKTLSDAASSAEGVGMLSPARSFAAREVWCTLEIEQSVW